MDEIVPIGLIAGGGFFASIGLIWIGRTVAFLRKAIQAEGTVIGHHAWTDNDNMSWFSPKIVFQDSTGDVREVVIRAAASPGTPELAEGERVRVLYDPTNPSRVRTTMACDLWAGFVPLVLGLGGLIAGIVEL